MGEFFNRSFSLNLGGKLIASESVDGNANHPLRVVFSIERDLTREPNAAEVTIYNLSETSRAKVADRAIQATLEAGHSGRSSTIFAGRLEYGSTSRDGPDWVTTFEATDGAKELRESRINLSFQPGIGVADVIKRAAEAMGVNVGNVADKVSSGNIRGAIQEFGNGIVLSGNATDQFDKVAKSLGYEWSVQDGEIQLLEQGGVTDENQAVKLTSSTGLIGSPQSGDDGVVEVRALLVPGLTPGRRVQVQSREVDGFFRVERTVYTGDTRGQDWYADLEVKPL